MSSPSSATSAINDDEPTTVNDSEQNSTADSESTTQNNSSSTINTDNNDVESETITSNNDSIQTKDDSNVKYDAEVDASLKNEKQNKIRPQTVPANSLLCKKIYIIF